ncbi:MAG: hypothetical protein M3Q88_04365 [Pseudomonadota bacterium]|nr:hypothetical protein [Pseudomonadota bacterium]
MKQIALFAALAPLTLGACATLFGSASPFAYDKKGDLVEFNYSWSAEASRNPSLVRRLRGDLERSFATAAATAEADRARALAMKRPFRAHQYSRRWTTAGQSSRLLSLDGRLLASTGRAQPSHGADGLLWDRSARAEVKLDRLFNTSAALDRLVRVPGCGMLDLERARRHRARVTPGAAFTDCPASSALTLVPSDTNRNRRFDHIRLTAPHSVAGAYAEGDHSIALPITATMLAAIKPAFRPSFEVGQPQ